MNHEPVHPDLIWFPISVALAASFALAVATSPHAPSLPVIAGEQQPPRCVFTGDGELDAIWVPCTELGLAGGA